MNSYLRAVFAGRGDDGLLQRFQLAVWPDLGGRWRHVDRWPNAAARARVMEVFQRLHTLEPAQVGHRWGYGPPSGPPTLPCPIAAARGLTMRRLLRWLRRWLGRGGLEVAGGAPFMSGISEAGRIYRVVRGVAVSNPRVQ